MDNNSNNITTIIIIIIYYYNFGFLAILLDVVPWHSSFIIVI